MLFNIYIENHARLDGVEDFISILKQIISARGHEVKVSRDLEIDCPNIIIDEFTNYICNKKIIAFKRDNPQGNLIYLLTEFIEDRLLVRSFNFFGVFFAASLIAAMNIYFRYRRKDFLPASFFDYVIAILYSPLLVLYMIWHKLDNLLRYLIRKKRISLTYRLHRLAYMHMRFLGLQRMVEYADSFILSHEEIVKSVDKLSKNISKQKEVIGVIYPELDFEKIESGLFDKTGLFIEITGSVTRFRQKFIKAINRDIVVLGLNNAWKPCLALSFSGYKNKFLKRGAFSLHPPQSKFWRYSSPTRIYRALQYNLNMPVLTKFFGQNPIENLCLILKGDESLIQMSEFYADKQKAIDFLQPRVMQYMETVSKANNQVVDVMVKRFLERRASNS